MQETYTLWAVVLKNLPWESIMALAGVILGACISPWVLNRYEKIKERRELRSKVIQLTYKFFSVYKEQFTTSNWFAVNSRRKLEIELQLAKSNGETTFKKEQEKRMIETVLEKQEKSLDNCYEKLVDIEPELIYYISRMNGIYGKKNFTLINSLLQPRLDASNDGKVLYSYLDLDQQSFENIVTNLKAELDNRYKQLNNECSEIIEKINKII